MELTKPWLKSLVANNASQLSECLAEQGVIDGRCDDVGGRTFLRLPSAQQSVIQAIYREGVLQRFDRLPHAIHDEKAQWFLRAFRRLNPQLSVFDRFVFTFDQARVAFTGKVLTPSPPSEQDLYPVCDEMDRQLGMRLSWFLLGLLGFLPLDFTHVVVQFDMQGDGYLKANERQLLYDWYVHQRDYQVFGHIWSYRDLES